jgi:DNA-binding MarR family transcriptional regulator
MEINYVNEIESILGEINRKLNTELKKEMVRMDFSLSHFYILSSLFKNGVMKAGDIAREIDVTNATLTFLLDKLEGEGLIKRVKDTEDRRVTLVEITGKGREVYSSLIALRRERMRELLENIPEEDIKNIYHFLLRIKAVLWK